MNDNKFLKYYKIWLDNDCQKDLKPSFDRIDNKKNYSFDNLQILQWKDNNLKGRKEHSKKVNQYDLDGNFIRTFNSTIEASRAVKGYKSNISKCCKGEYKTSSGYIWKYAKE